MKKLLPILLSLLSLHAFSGTYYFSASGSDANAGTSTGAPWQTMAKFNATSFTGSDIVLFHRDDIFYGQMIPHSGSVGNPVSIGAYGSGAMPVITGFTTVSAWTNLGGNIWESTSAVSTLSTCNMVSIGGANTPMGRTPNTGYYTYQSAVGHTSITSSSLSGSPNYTGYEIAKRDNNYRFNRGIVNSQSGGTLNYTTTASDNATANYGFFIQNGPNTLDQQNEWYYDPSTKKIRVYSTSSPTNVKVATVDTLLTIKQKDWITVDGIKFTGSNKISIALLGSANCIIQNYGIDFSGIDAIWNYQDYAPNASTNLTITNGVVDHTNNRFLKTCKGATNAYIANNTIRNTGMIPGAGSSDDDNYSAVIVFGAASVIEYNSIVNTGFNPIAFYANDVTAQFNYIDSFCTVKSDGGGIYSWVGNPSSGGSGVAYTGINIISNIIKNGIGEAAGTSAPASFLAHGIYMDDWSAYANIIGNTSAFNANSNLYLHNAHDITVYGNNFYGAKLNDILMSSFDAGSLIRNISFKKNKIISNSLALKCISYDSQGNDIASFFSVLDSNVYARPLADNNTMDYSINGYSSFGHLTLAQWQTYVATKDAHSTKSPVAISNVNDLRFEYNATASPVTIPLGANYRKFDNSVVSSLTLQDHASEILIYDSPLSGNISPVANAGSDQTLTLPTNTTTLSGSGSDADGTIASYAWSKLSGPSSYGLTGAGSPTPNLTGLVQGVYVFQLTVTDNLGATGSDNMTVTVNPANVLPVANAGSNQTITLPVSSASLTGSGTDADGTITGYLWSKISGPGATTISTPTSQNPTVLGLQQGVYVFQLQVTDNNGGTNTATVQVTVNAAVAGNSIQVHGRLIFVQ